MKGKVDMANLTDELSIALADELERDERTDDSQIEVINEGGVITLTGHALSHQARAAAAEIASNYPGVLSVINDITVGDMDEPDGPRRIVPLPVRPLNSSQ
jgi:osmotically-inducible protein OsmY